MTTEPDTTAAPDPRPVFELTDGELGLLTIALVDVIPRIQQYVNVTTDETVQTKDLIFKLIEMRNAGYGFNGSVRVTPTGTELRWEGKPDDGKTHP